MFLVPRLDSSGTEVFFATLGAAGVARSASREVNDDFAIVSATGSTSDVREAESTAFTLY